MFKALLLENAPAYVASIQSLDPARLPAGDVLVAPAYSMLNYKDGLLVKACAEAGSTMSTCAACPSGCAR